MSLKVQVDVLVNDKPVTYFTHEGDTYIEGRSGSKYSIKVKNLTATRLEIVLSVDGLSVMDGSPASEASRGYVLDAFKTIDIKGWRTGDSSVATFEFGDKENSYTAKLGNGTNNTGVIGVLAFSEKYVAPIYISRPFTYYDNSDHWYRSYQPINNGTGVLTGQAMGIGGSNATSDASQSKEEYTKGGSIRGVEISASSASINNVGTKFGEEIESKVSETKFERADTGASMITIYYDSKKGLEARGIVVDQRKLKPDAFPASNKYCKRV